MAMVYQWRFLAVNVTLILMFDYLLGVSGVPQMNLTGLDHVVVNQPYSFLCYATPGTDVVHPISFFQKGTISLCTILDPCEIPNVATGYACGCEADSGNSKVYKLTMNISISHDDQWICRHGTDDASPLFQLVVNTPVTSVTIKVDGAASASIYVLSGTPVKFTLVIEGAKPPPTSSDIKCYVEDANDRSGTLGTPSTSDRTTTVNATYSFNVTDNKKEFFCNVTNSLMNDQRDAAIKSNTIQLNVTGASISTTPNPSGGASSCDSTCIRIVVGVSVGIIIIWLYV